MKLVKNLIIEIKNFLEKNVKNNTQQEILNMLKSISLEKQNYVYQKPNKIPKLQSLQKALASIKSKPLFPIKNSIYMSLDKLKWNIDNGSFYEKILVLANII